MTPQTSLAQQHSRALLGGASPRELAALAYDWDFWSRPDQRAPRHEWRVWLILAGRGWGKTRTGAEAIREYVQQGDGSERIALVGSTAADVRDVMVLGESGLLNIFPPHQRPKYQPSRRRVVFHTGAVATLYSAQEPDRLRGPQHGMAWCDELAAWARLDDTWSNLMMGLRLGDQPRVIVTTTPRPLSILRGFVDEAANDSTVVITRGRTFDNAGNLPESFLSAIQSAYGGTRLGRQELEGEILEPAGGLFRPEWFLHIDPSSLPRLSTTVVSIDPAITTRNDETGIIVCGRHADRGFVLEDKSGTYTPDQWGRIAVDLARKYRAKIVAEVNRGGDLVATTIRQFDRSVHIKEVRANRGKDTRAEPVAALYEQRRISHVGTFQKLEQQMVEWAPTSQEAMRAQKQATSPDRMDALVWGITELGFHLGVATYRSVPGAGLPSDR